jgi:hypothetical protein
VGGHDTRLRSEQESQRNQRSTNATPASVLGLRTASYCTENEGTPIHHFAFVCSRLLGLDLREASTPYLAWSETTTDLRYMQNRRNALLKPIICRLAKVLPLI